MNSQLKKGVLEQCVLATLAQGDSYGYQIVKNLSMILPITESTLYPILKRLEAGDKVRTYSQEHNGRLRKYYRISKQGRQVLHHFLEEEWPLLQVIRDYIERGVQSEP